MMLSRHKYKQAETMMSTRKQRRQDGGIAAMSRTQRSAECRLDRNRIRTVSNDYFRSGSQVQGSDRLNDATTLRTVKSLRDGKKSA